MSSFTYVAAPLFELLLYLHVAVSIFIFARKYCPIMIPSSLKTLGMLDFQGNFFTSYHLLLAQEERLFRKKVVIFPSFSLVIMKFFFTNRTNFVY